MKPDLLNLYGKMYRSRVFEIKVCELWRAGMISGEMHTGLGEEAVAAGTVDILQEGDAMALDHRGTPPLVMRGTDLRALLHELLGNEEGLCRGYGGHMHLFDRALTAASSGIVGASGPLGSGFALALQYLSPGRLAIAYFGEGSLNQGMLLESFNLASVWKLPVIFICKDNSLAITTDSPSVTAGRIPERIQGFGIPVSEVDGLDVEAVWQAGLKASEHVRAGKGPFFIWAHCVHLEGHFLGDPLLGVVRNALGELKERTGPVFKSVVGRKGSGLSTKIKSLTKISSLVAAASKQSRKKYDPIERARKKLKMLGEAPSELEDKIEREIEETVRSVLDGHQKGDLS